MEALYTLNSPPLVSCNLGLLASNVLVSPLSPKVGSKWKLWDSGAAGLAHVGDAWAAIPLWNPYMNLLESPSRALIGPPLS